MSRVIHVFASPFPRVVPTGRVLDEHCECGHMRTAHNDNRLGFGLAYCSRCRCKGFKWALHEFAQDARPQRRKDAAANR